MGQPGMGVMIRALFGDGGRSAKAFQGGLGKTIESATLFDDKLHLAFTDGTKLTFADEGQSCCEDRYMHTDDDLTTFAGAKFIGAEIKEAPDVKGEDDYGDHEVQFLEVQTDKGVFTMASHNEHNGYYGGFSIECSD